MQNFQSRLIIIIGTLLITSGVIILTSNYFNEKVDNAFIGFPIHEGNHIIKVSYASPYLLIGLILSMIGDMIFLPIIYADKGKRED